MQGLAKCFSVIMSTFWKEAEREGGGVEGGRMEGGRRGGEEEGRRERRKGGRNGGRMGHRSTVCEKVGVSISFIVFSGSIYL